MSADEHYGHLNPAKTEQLKRRGAPSPGLVGTNVPCLPATATSRPATARTFCFAYLFTLIFSRNVQRSGPHSLSASRTLHSGLQMEALPPACLCRAAEAPLPEAEGTGSTAAVTGCPGDEAPSPVCPTRPLGSSPVLCREEGARLPCPGLGPSTGTWFCTQRFPDPGPQGPARLRYPAGARPRPHLLLQPLPLTRATGRNQKYRTPGT